MFRFAASAALLTASAAIVLGVWAGTAWAQPAVEEGRAPAIPGLAPLSEVPVLETPPIDVQGALAAARAASVAVGPGAPVRFAEPFTVDVSPLGYGRWEAGSDGRTAVWRLRVVSEGAVSLNLGFSRYRMPPGGRLRVHTLDGAEVLGPYTDADNEEHGELWTPVLSGGDAVIEVAVPVDRIGELDLGLAKVNRGFRDLVTVASPSQGSCHVDVACSGGDLYRDEIRSVGHYSVRGVFKCSGALVNNTAEDGRMFFLTARHCFTDPSAQAASVVVYWNFQRPVCGAGAGTRRDSQSGAVLRVSLAVSATDVLLLELDDEPDPDHELYLAGWDSDSSAPASGVGIHHPGLHYKSISTASEALTRTNWRQDDTSEAGTHWRVAAWDSGSTEGGSSGSPLFDGDKRIVGVLTGGHAECGNDGPDWYGALTASWTSSDGSSARQLSDWLDPGGTRATSLDGMNPNHRPRSLRALDDKAAKVPADGGAGEALSLDLAPYFQDPDGDALTYVATSSDESAVTTSVTGSSVSLTPVARGSATITVTVTDTGGSNKEAVQTFEFTVGDNRSPETSGTLADQSLNEGATAQFDLASAFTDGDGDALTYAVSSTDTSVATVALSGSTLTVTAVDGLATATVDVTATDAAGSNTKARHRFDVTVLNEAPRAVGSLVDVTLRVGDGNEVVDASPAFTDPDGDALIYGPSSSARDVVRSTISGSEITLIPVARGNATVAVTAMDPDGSRMPTTQTFAVRVKGRRAVAVSTDELSVGEAATATYTVALGSEPTGQVTVTPTVVSSTKITVSPSSLTFDATAWETARTVTVAGVQDDDAVHETVTIDHAVSGADYGSVAAASVKVKVYDDEATPVLSAPQARAPENGGSMTFDLTLSHAVSSEVTLDYETVNNHAQAGQDYTAVSGSLTFPAGTTARKIAVGIIDDDEYAEGDENFQLYLRNLRNATLDRDSSPGLLYGTIEDDEGPEVWPYWIRVRGADAREGAVVELSLRFSQNVDREVRLGVELATGGGADQTDYSVRPALPSTVVFRPGEKRKSIWLGVIDDVDDDDCESVTLKIVPESPGVITTSGQTTLPIIDNDGARRECPDDSGGSSPQPPGAGDGPPAGGGDGSPPPSEPEPEPPPPPPSRPPAAAFTVEGATCDEELCRAVAGEALRFTDTSTGTVRFRRWEFGDGTTSRSGAPVYAWASPGFHEVLLEVSDGSAPSTVRRTFLVTAAAPAGTCIADAETLCLQDSRYAVTVEWRDGAGGSGSGRVVHAGTNDSGMFSFFDRANWEVLIKVLDGCAANGHVWVFGGSTTDLGYVIRVTDTATGALKEYRNEPGSPAAAITDIAAFRDGCQP